MATPCIIDCDPGGDDTVAILLALASPELELLGITTVAGNRPLPQTTANALRALEFAGRTDIPVAAGAEAPLVRELYVRPQAAETADRGVFDLPAPATEPIAEHGVDFLAERLLASSGPVVVFPIGPLTNIALLLARYPEAAARIARLEIMGGAIELGNTTPAAEFNIWFDPEAARRVFASGVELTMIGLDVTHRAGIGPEHLPALKEAGLAGALVGNHVERWLADPARTRFFPGVPIHDALTVAQFIRRDLVRTEHVHVEIDCESQLCRGRTVCDMRGRLGLEPNAHVGVETEPDGFAAFLTERLAALG
jgi:inosine-uridine nucleoside N-ribohydrolase